MTKQTLPFYIANLEDMTVAAAKAQAKLWADAFRSPDWNNGDGFQSAFASMILEKAGKSITPADIDAFEAKLAELTVSPDMIDDLEVEYKNAGFVNGKLGHGRCEIFVDYHANRLLKVAIDAFGTEPKSIGSRLDMMVPCKSQSKIWTVGVTAAFGYGAPSKGVWSTTKQVPTNAYEVINRLDNRRGHAGAAWKNDIEEGVGELVWVQLSPDTISPSVQIHKILGYVKESYWYDPSDNYYSDMRLCGSFEYACSQVLEDGYLALAVRK